MACLGPLTGYASKIVNPSGKRSLVFRKSEAHSGVPISIPCGQCVECRLAHAGSWAVRIVKEASCYPSNSFITLTYDNEHLPADKSLSRRDIALFHKRLHNRLLRDRGYGIRFYYSGEYGETYGRPHYHSIIFDFGFPDKVFYKKNARGEPIYRSEFLSELWPAGGNGIGDVTFETAAYTAGYVVDKITGEKADAFYTRLDDEGRPHRIETPFSFMSKGIGKPWFLKYGCETYRDDNVVVAGRVRRPPRYFDKLFEGIDPDRLLRLKSVRKRRALLLSRNNSSRTSYAREKIVKARLAQFRKDVTS